MALWANGISSALQMDDHAYQPKLNGAGQPVIPMTAEQKYEFGKYERARAVPVTSQPCTLLQRGFCCCCCWQICRAI